MNSKILNKVGILVFILFSFHVSAQSGHKFRLEADKEYMKQNYPEAEIKYKKALEKEEEYKGNYNLGNTLYKQKRYDEAVEFYEKAAKETSDSLTKSKIYHNLGNSWFQLQKYDKSLENYKQSLRYNPNDPNTRKDFSMVKKILKQQQQQQQQQQNKNNKNNKDQKQNNKSQQNKENKNKNNKNNDNRDQQNKDQQNKNNQNQNKQDSLKNEQQQQQQQMGQDSMQNLPDSLRLSKQELLKLLKAIENDDKEIQKRIRKGGKSKKRDKDW